MSRHSPSDGPVVTSSESSDRQFDDWQPLEDLLSSLAEPSAGRLSDDLSDSHEALFSQLGR
ncbi:MAG: hypothetical protein EA424_24500 [Planctomycetaceae bacterium]|nr:MAG: hypothetical protein EA424_24500 [Planctomycetaceae bacterium]